MKKKRLGEILRERGQVSAADLSSVLQEQQAQARLIHLGELLLQREMVSKPNLIAALMEVAQVPYIDCTTVQIDPKILQLIPGAMARRCRALPVGFEGLELVVAMAEPQNLQNIDELRFKTGKVIAPRLAFRTEIDGAIAKYYRLEPEPVAVSNGSALTGEEQRDIEFISSSEQQRNIEAMREMQVELNQKSKTTPAVLLVASMIQLAAAKRASDIHIEPQSADVIIRFRVDGLLREHQRIPRNLQHTVVSRIKILSDMDISERRAPQDGRFLVRIGNRRIDFRISTLPTQYGEKVVMRLLESEAVQASFESLGIPPWIEARFKRMLGFPQGMILVTGPTGSGKSTTLYAALTFLRKPSINIITVEDPVEYAIPGLNQVQINSKAGMTFATSLRSILRQDPNVIMVGEIRDKETAEIALKAAQTGHLVLSTLHTNDSVSAVTRLLDLGVPAFQIAGSFTGIIAQRLVRKLCSCHKTVPAGPEFANQLLLAGASQPPASQNLPNGCEKCDLSGYRGRIGIYELLPFDEAVRAAIREGTNTDGIRATARRGGMKLMFEYAMEQVAAGLTTFEEVERVVPIEQVKTLSCGACHRKLAGNFLFCPYCGAQANVEPQGNERQFVLAERRAVNE
jgi:type IV pilus assembly protein PilB